MVNSLREALLESLFPNHCVLCGLRSRGPLPLCTGCAGELQPNSRCCRHCALPLAVGTASTLCGSCLQQPPPFHCVHAPWLYSEELAHLIHRWKFQGETRLTPLLASLWLQRSANLEPPDLLIPTPLHWRRRWQRGFNQCELLCRALRRRSPAMAGVPLEPGAVRRHRSTPAQSSMDARARRRNLHGAFTVRKPCAKLRAAVVDDVMTTGATAAAIARSLRDAGADRVDIWCLARTPAPT